MADISIATWFLLVSVACLCCAFHLAAEAYGRRRRRKLIDAKLSARLAAREQRLASGREWVHQKYGSRA